MKRKGKSRRTKVVHVRVTPEKYEKIQEKFKTTIHRVLAEYLRDMLLQEPITIWARSKSLDEFLPVAIGIKKELNAIGINLNQAVKRLQQWQGEEEWKESLEYYQASQFSVQQKIEDIKSVLIKTYKLFETGSSS
jgi:hypothetical protein